MSTPTVTIVGNLATDANSGTTKSGRPYANFTIIAQDRKRDEQGNWTDGNKCPLRVNMWSTLALNAAQSLSKGMRVIAVGRMYQTSWQDRDGNTRYQMEMVADAIGPDLSYATAQVVKNQRGQSAGFQPAPAPTVQSAAMWSQPQAATGDPDPWGGPAGGDEF